MIYNGNGFQQVMDAKIQREISYGNFGKKNDMKSKWVTDYIQGIPFTKNSKPFDSNVCANAKMAKDNFVNYWTRILSLDAEKKKALDDMWESAIYAESECDGAKTPLLILLGKGEMTQDSFFEMIYKVCNC